MNKINRKKNAVRNIFFGLAVNIYKVLIPFVMRTAMIYLMGVQYLGLSSLFSSVLQVLNLAELGVGSAMIYSMYKPIAEDDKIRICALLKMYKIYYRVIGLVIAFLGLLLLPFIPKMISGDIPPNINIYILYIMNLFATVSSYWLFAYKTSILQAHQRTDISSKILLITSSFQYAIQLGVLFWFHNYYLYMIVMLFIQIISNILNAAYANKLYPELVPKGELTEEEVGIVNDRIRDFFTAKLGGVIVGSVDTIVISAFLGLTTLAIYQNYYFIMNAVCGLVNVLFSSIIAGVGNSLVTESVEKNYNDFETLTFITCFVLNVCCCCFIGLYQPFMRIWVGEELMMGFEYVVLFVILFFCLELAKMWATIKDAAGLWHADRYRPLTGALINLTLNLVLVNYIGLYGIILSTVLSYVFVSMPWLISNLFELLYKRPLLLYVRNLSVYILTTIGCCLICNSICGKISLDSMWGLISKGMVCVCVPFSIQCLLYCKKEAYLKTIELIKSWIDGKGISI